MRYQQPQVGPLNPERPLKALFNAATPAQQGVVALATGSAWNKVATLHGVGLQGGYVSSAAAVFVDSNNNGNLQAACNTQHIVFVVLSNAALEGIASVGLSATDSSPRTILQNNAGTLRVFDTTLGYTNMGTAIIGQRYVFSIVYNDFAPYTTSYYLNGVFITSANNYRRSTLRVWLGTGYPASSVNAAVLSYTGREGIAESPTEVARYAANPWQIFTAPRRLWAAVGAPATPTGAFAATLANAALSSAGVVASVGPFATTLASATMAAAGSVAAQPSGSIAATLGNATLAAAGVVLDIGNFATTLSGAVLSASGIVASSATGTLNTTLAGASLTASGFTGAAPPPAPTQYRRRAPHRSIQ